MGAAVFRKDIYQRNKNYDNPVHFKSESEYLFQHNVIQLLTVPIEAH